MSTAVRKSTSVLSSLLLFILFNVVCDNYIFDVFGKQRPTLGFSLMLGTLLLQVVATPIQAGFSDFYCRKKSLIISLSASLVSLILLAIYDMNILYWTPILIIVNFIKGGLGNTASLAWAAIGDTQTKNFRFSFALSTAMFALAYIFLFYIKIIFSDYYLNLILIGVFVGLIYVCVKYFDDVRDKHHRVRTSSQLRAVLNNSPEI